MEKSKETAPTELYVQPLAREHLIQVEVILRLNITKPQITTIDEEINLAISRMKNSLEDPSGFPQYVVVNGSNGQVLGVMGLNAVNEKLKDKNGIDETTLEIINAYANPKTKAKDIGYKLLTNIITIAINAGFRRIVAVSGPRYKDKGHKFWTKHFGEPKKLKDYYGQDIDANLWLYDIPKDISDRPDMLPSLGGVALKHK